MKNNCSGGHDYKTQADRVGHRCVFLSRLEPYLQQECIPVGCVLSASVAVCRGGGLPAPGGSAPGGCLLPGGVCSQGGVCSRGGTCYWGGVVFQHD